MRAWMMDRGGGDLDRLPNGVVVVIESIRTTGSQDLNLLPFERVGQGVNRRLGFVWYFKQPFNNRLDFVLIYLVFISIYTY